MTKDQPRRKQSRDARRVQLIEATIETMALRGYARTTLTEVARTAGLSHGLVNFHFETKEKLLTETLVYLYEEYRLNWTGFLAAAGPSPAAQLDAMLRADFQPEICTPTRLAAWCSFWGEAQARPLYQERCGANDDIYNEKMEQIVAALLAQSGAPGNAARIARVIRITTEGIWLDMMTLSQPYDAAEGLATVHTCVAAFFPQHFGENGLLQG
jgi:AcrR family transcriptional regulator